MRLHRLVLKNYRGIAERAIEFADTGVTVVSGANEIGKSSMIEALDLLLESKDRSTKKNVKQVKPTHADVGAEVTAEISTGPYRFVYRKRFHKRCETELTVLAPVRAQLTGDEAHDRVRAILDETVDTGLWQAQRVMQAASTSAVDLSGCDALSRALDVAASDTADVADGPCGTEPLLIDKIELEYGRYFTATGRPTGEWLAAINRLKTAGGDVESCEAAVAEVEERVQAHATLTRELADLAGQRDGVAARRAAARAAADVVDALTDQLHTAKAECTTLTAAGTAAAAAHEQRVRLCADVDARSAAVDSADAAVVEAAEAEQVGREVVAEADDDAAAADEAHHRADQRVSTARRVVVHLVERDEAGRLATRLDRIDTANRELEAISAQLSLIALTENGFRDIERAASAMALARAQADLAATSVEITADSDIEVRTGGDPITLAAGQSLSLSVTEATAVGVPGVLGLRVTPGATASETYSKLVVAQDNLRALLTVAGVPSVEQAGLVDRRRRDLIAERDRLGATLAGIRGDDDVDRLRARLAALRAGRHPEDADSDVDITAARAELTAAEAAQVQTTEVCGTQRKVATAAAAQLVERSTQLALRRDRAAVARTELAAAKNRLTDARAVATDDELATRARDGARAAADAQGLVGELAARLADAGPDVVAVELAAAVSADEDLETRHGGVARRLHDIAVELAVFGTEGRTGKLDSARIAQKHAAGAHSRIEERARAAELLRSVMARHRDDTRLRYVEPFRAEIERLGRAVFGPTFEVEVDSDLQIRSRTLEGCTVPFESLSGGAREQLGIIARLAVAALVGKADTVPVVIDDALGFTDPDRLTKMGSVFDLVGTDGQVIVLTCAPERYRTITDAHRVQLTA